MSKTWENIRNYAVEVKGLQDQEMDVDISGPKTEARLDQTIKELQERLKRQQIELEKLRASSDSPPPTAPSTNPRERLMQLRTIKTAYEQMTPERPDLPKPNSALPALLAARVIQRSTIDSKQNISSTQSQLETVQHQILHEESQLSDAKLLETSLEARTTRLQTTQHEKAGQSASDKAKELIRAKQKRKQTFQRETEGLQNALIDFIEEHLAAMLAAEELGGPVVGELTDVDEDMLTAGFSSQGKPKSSKSSASNAEDKRQRRIDEIWGNSENQHDSEKEAAAEEVRGLLEKLIAAKGGYVGLERDNAVARFVVRAKVAQFHPKDARRLRLIDFARESDT